MVKKIYKVGWSETFGFTPGGSLLSQRFPSTRFGYHHQQNKGRNNK